MRKTVPMTFGQLWAEYVDTNPAVVRRLAEARIPELWEGIVGAAVASRTTSINIEKGVMYVKISSSVMRNEVFLRREQLKDDVNKAVGMRVINVVIVK